jgi:hypothetical protein
MASGTTRSWAYYGFGALDTSRSMILMPGVTASIWGPTVAMPADAMGVTLDSIDEAHRVIHADEEQPSPSPRLSTTTGSCTSRATTCL